MASGSNILPYSRILHADQARETRRIPTQTRYFPESTTLHNGETRHSRRWHCVVIGKPTLAGWCLIYTLTVGSSQIWMNDHLMATVATKTFDLLTIFLPIYPLVNSLGESTVHPELLEQPDSRHRLLIQGKAFVSAGATAMPKNLPSRPIFRKCLTRETALHKKLLAIPGWSSPFQTLSLDTGIIFEQSALRFSKTRTQQTLARLLLNLDLNLCHYLTVVIACC